MITIGRASKRSRDEGDEPLESVARSLYWAAVLAAAVVLLVAWFLPVCTLESTGHIGGGEEQVIQDFSRTVWFWDLGPIGVLLLLAPVGLVVLAWLSRRAPESAGPIALTVLIALVANTYLAASVADRAWRDVATPAAFAEQRPTPRCELSGYGRSYTSYDASMQRIPKFSCALPLEGPMLDLHEEVVDAGYTAGGLAAFHTGVGLHLVITVSFLLALCSGWTLLRRRMSRLGAGLTIAAAIGLVYVVALIDSLSHLS